MADSEGGGPKGKLVGGRINGHAEFRAVSEHFDQRAQKKAGAAWSHNFLNLKPWHPANYKNQRLLYIAEKKAEDKEKRRKEGEREFNQEQAKFHQIQMMKGEDKVRAKDLASVAFMYQKPPGWKDEAENAALEAESENAKAKEVIKRDIYGNKVATEEQFEVLKNAPRLASVGKDDAVHHKPFGVQIRMVKCLKCGKWGHQAGDRECTGGVLESIKHMDEVHPQDNKQIGESIPSLTAEAAREMSKKWVLKTEEGHLDPNDPLNQLVSDEEEEVDLSGIDSLMSQLKKSERKRLLKAIKGTIGEDDEDKKVKKSSKRSKEKKRKKEKKDKY